MNISIDVKTLIENNLTIQEYFFLNFIANKEKDLLIEYINLFDKILTRDNVLALAARGFLILKDPESSTFDNIVLTEKFDSIKLDGKKAIEELKETYPKQTPNKRRLQADAHKWGPKYLTLIDRDKTLHEKVLKCIKAEERDRKNTGQEEFWAMMSTYINNKRWEVYIKDIDNFNEENNIFSKDI